MMFANKEFLLSSARSLGKFIILSHFITEYVVEPTMTIGPSMMPTLNIVGDLLLVDKTINMPLWISSLLGIKIIPELGDIVVARSPNDPAQTVCKRVMALPGQRNSAGLLIPKGRVWLEGDNKSNSTDSRDYGPVPLSLVEGVVALRLWPPSKIGKLERIVPLTYREKPTDI